MNTPKSTNTQDPGRYAALEQRIVDQLGIHQDELDPAIQIKLDRARRQALAASEHSTLRWRAWPWLATASAACLALFMLIGLNRTELLEPPTTIDLDLLTMSEFDLLNQDPAFMAWLAEQDIDRIENNERQPGGSS